MLKYINRKKSSRSYVRNQTHIKCNKLYPEYKKRDKYDETTAF